MPRDNQDIVVGTVVAPLGVRGEVKASIQTDFPERFAAGREVTVKLAEDELRRLKILESRPQKGGMVLKFGGVDTRSEAEALRNWNIVIKEDELAELGEGQFYIFDLIGLKVATDDGRELGEVKEVLQSGANDVYVTSTGVCIPAIKSVVLNVDLAAGLMIIHPVPGLLAED